MGNNVLVFAEQRNSNLKKVAFEMLGMGKQLADGLGGSVEAVLLGSDLGGLPDTLAQYGATKVYVADDPSLALYSSEAYTDTVADLVRKIQPAIVLLGATAMGKDLGPRMAACLEVGLAADCTAFAIEGGRLVAIRPMFAGKALAKVKLNGNPQMATGRPNVFPAPAPDAGKTAVVEAIPANKSNLRARVVDVTTAGKGEVDVAEAEFIVSGGRGVGGPEGFAPIRSLAQVLGAAVGASRAAVDAGWIDHGHQVGQTGKTVTPTLYIACGISGAIQHQAGMRTSKYIVAINKDPEAPIFRMARFGVVGDLFSILPALTEAFHKKLGK
jgi:electron transfer flavoprotein alpha subunit